jgi:hypothetical protein
MRTEALTLMRSGIEAQYDEQPARAAVGTRSEGRHAAFATQLASRSSYAARLSQIPGPRPAADARMRLSS